MYTLQLAPLITSDIDHIVEICQRHNVAMLGIFGSYARGEHTSHSDIDLLVRFTNPVSLLTMITVEQELSQTLGRDVDLVTEASLHSSLRPSILRDLRVLYESA